MGWKTRLQYGAMTDDWEKGQETLTDGTERQEQFMTDEDWKQWFKIYIYTVCICGEDDNW